MDFILLPSLILLEALQRSKILAALALRRVARILSTHSPQVREEAGGVLIEIVRS